MFNLPGSFLHPEADPAEIARSARSLLSPRRMLPLSYSSGDNTTNSNSSGNNSNSDLNRMDKNMNGDGSMAPGNIVHPGDRADRETTTVRPRTQSAEVAGERSSSVPGANDSGPVPWLWVPRGGAPACRLVSQVALEAARYGETFCAALLA